MNKKEKEAFSYLFKTEKDVLKALEKIYRRALRELEEKILYTQGDPLMQNKVYRQQYQVALKGQVAAILERLHTQEYETIEEYLKDSYTDGYLATMYSIHAQGLPLIMPIAQDQIVRALVTDSAISEGLYKSLGTDLQKLRSVIVSEISRGIATNKSYGEIARNIANQTHIPLKRARTIVLTETHRIREEAAQDLRVKAKAKGCDIVKQWDATLDGRTRPTHRRLDGQIREVNEPFEIDGKKAMQPGGFGRPEEDINCRCVALTRARWALSEKELQIMKERAEFFGLDKTKDFEEFKRKYLDALEDDAK